MKLKKLKKSSSRLMQRACLVAGVCLLWLLGITSAYAQQQTKTLTGIVLDAKGELIIGASILEKGTTNAVMTDANGNFSITVHEGATLNISFLGYKTQSYVVGVANSARIVLQEDQQVLDEVVVVGYGSQKRQNLTGAVASVDVEKTLADRPVADVGRSLQGAVAGLSVVVPTGEVGSDPIFRIRGQIASINSTASSSPLILLDNVEIPSISLVNPDDIESITTLKDAAASSIYGAKAALGVILITTKKGTATDKITVTYSNNFAWSKVAKDIDMATIDGLEYTMSALERVGTSSAGAFWAINRESYERSKKWVEKYGNTITSDDPILYGRDWYVDAGTKRGIRLYDSYDYMIAEWTPTQTHNLSVNGMSGKVKYNIGLGYFDQQGLMKTAKQDDFQRYNATAKVSSDINKYVTVRAGMLFSQRTKSYPYITNSTTADPWLYVYRWGPLQPFGKTAEGYLVRSPASEAAQANTATHRNNYMNVNLGFTLNFTDNWTFDGDYTFANNDFLWNCPGTRYTAADSWSAAVLRKDAAGNQVYVNDNGDVVAAGAAGAMQAYDLPYTTYTSKGGNPDHLYRQSENRQQHTFNAYTTYNLHLDDHQIKLMAGLNIVKSDSKSHWSQRLELLDYANPQFDMAIGTQTVGGKAYWDATAGFFGRINYAFQDKYLLEANLRYDGSSKFPTDLKWRWFPSFSAGWRVSEETFMEWAKPALSALKFRGSWGTIGDQSVSSSLYVPTLAYGNTTWLDGTTRFTQYATPGTVDGNITWQDFETLDFGIDARFLSNELGVTVDWYQRYTRNMITPGITLPYAFGTAAPVGNYGELRTQGWEITVDFNHRFENGVGINAMATFADAVTDITDYPEEATKTVTSSGAFYKGKRYGDIWGYQTERLYQKDDFEYNADGTLKTIVVDGKTMNQLKGTDPVYQVFVQNSANFRFGPGDVKYKDQNGDNRITNGSGTEDDPGDLVIIGNSTPRYQYGFRVGADYFGFDFSMFFQGIGKREIWGDGSLVIPGYNPSDGAMSQAIAGDFWREDRTDAFYPRPYGINAVAGGNSAINNTHVQDRYLLNMAYLRLKNITLGYTLPENITRKIYLSKARVYMALENILTFDHLNGLPVDPEVITGYSMFNTANYNSSRTGVGAPMFKNISFGIQLTF
jgi:TonB-linked SusC/RagA family outer membrane protein